MVFLAILTGLLSLGNFYINANWNLSESAVFLTLIAQVVLTILTIFAAFGYKGRREVNGYKGYKIWTFRFAIIMVSVLGNICVLATIGLNKFGIINMF
ncbi:hypothetical protein [Miniphocaeibacter massiliensis]|uniref:hypothetical protein n=1 Tax=Miniphocaeibacter massiliensis TaxID=2041841 RepID=UPI000C1BA8EE|nr:hypothetical protein [Miniphocaeibacter massiliensis]